MEPRLAKIIQEISDDIVRAAREVMDSDVGINEKVNPPKNTLSGSRLYKQIKQSWRDNGDNVVIDTIFNHYLHFIEWDRPQMHKHRPPTKAIIKWLREKHIVSSNENIKSVAYLISRSIWEKGHKGRKVFDALDKYVDSGFENKYADMIFNCLMEDVDEWFK